MISYRLVRNASFLLITFHAKQDLMQIHVTSLLIHSGAPPEGSRRDILHPRMYFATLSEIPYGFTTSHPKSDSI